ncbi:RNA polymerase sigma-70 factor (ECF subfamily) [Gillisia mitskevichiae]|uniref:RNA polymerase sigma-70 factor (ECF subfamily) n=1 Tax=Gillisia mitskevichiae TaxID=270921 RepID=A0A495NY86_9FLAO|nr:RNA polymerase sigma factor [Gillisia mitskevichiae]RKS42725.1 RNA polymerase sigma-70 factor (ECF subfamily) [Gillisia mitskevichiae]
MTPTITYTDDLIVRCQKQEQRAQLEVYKKYYKAMYNTALRIVKDTAEAEDIMQEGFIKAFSKIHTFEGKSTFGAWIKKIVVNLSINAYNKRIKYAQVSYNDEFKNEIYEGDEIGVIEEEENNCKIQHILKKFDFLKENYRVILTLHLIDGYDYEEICDILKLSPANCRTTISRAKEQLRKILSENER